jgi:hypothetical protein
VWDGFSEWNRRLSGSSERWKGKNWEMKNIRKKAQTLQMNDWDKNQFEKQKKTKSDEQKINKNKKFPQIQHKRLRVAGLRG